MNNNNNNFKKLINSITIKNHIFRYVKEINIKLNLLSYNWYSLSNNPVQLLYRDLYDRYLDELDHLLTVERMNQNDRDRNKFKILGYTHYLEVAYRRCRQRGLLTLLNRIIEKYSHYIHTDVIYNESFITDEIISACKSGQLNIIESIHSINNNSNYDSDKQSIPVKGYLNTKAMEIAAGAGHLNIVKFIDQNYNSNNNKLPTTVIHESISNAVNNSHIPIVEYFYTEGGAEDFSQSLVSSCIVKAATNGDIEMLKFFCENQILDRSKKTVQHTPQTFRAMESALLKASLGGHQHIIEYLLTAFLNKRRAYPYRIVEILENVATGGHLEYLKVLNQSMNELGEVITYRAMDAAAEHGHLEVIRFLHENHSAETKLCTVQALRAALAGGHHDCANFIIEHRKEIWTFESLEICCTRASQINTFIKLLEKIHMAKSKVGGVTPIDLSKSFTTAIKWNRASIVSYLLDMFPTIIDPFISSQQQRLSFVHQLIQSGCEIFKLLRKYLSDEDIILGNLYAGEEKSNSTKMTSIDMEASQGNVEIIRYFHENISIPSSLSTMLSGGCHCCTVSSMRGAVGYEKVECINYLYEIHPEYINSVCPTIVSYELLALGENRSSFEILKFLHEKGVNVEDKNGALTNAFMKGNFRVAELIYNQIHQDYASKHLLSWAETNKKLALLEFISQYNLHDNTVYGEEEDYYHDY